MCGRYALFTLPEGLVERFRFEHGFELRPRFNIAPGQTSPVVRQLPDDGRVALSAKWGLIPSWVKNPNMVKPINVKVETAATGPMFRNGMRKQRVLVPASGFYEWQVVPGGVNQPYFVRMVHGEPFTFGGIIEYWHGSEGLVTTYAILTTVANERVSSIHQRMPVIIREGAWDMWLDPKLTDPDALQPLMAPYPGQLMDLYPVSQRLSKTSEDDAELIVPV